MKCKYTDMGCRGVECQDCEIQKVHDSFTPVLNMLYNTRGQILMTMTRPYPDIEDNDFKVVRN